MIFIGLKPANFLNLKWKSSMEEIRYEKYKRLIISKASKWSYCISMDIDDLISEGNIVFCKCLKTYKSSKSSFSTYLYRGLDYHYKNLAKKRFECNKHIDNDRIDNSINIFRITSFRIALEKLSSDAQQLINIVLNTPKKLIEICCRVTKQTLTIYLTQYLDWTIYRCWKTFREIRYALGEV